MLIAHATEYYVGIKPDEMSEGGYPSFAEMYFGGCEKWFSNKAKALEYLNTFEDWEQEMLQLGEHTWVEADIPF